jgi:imidazolonepropionase-like amidohydrolase
MEKILFTNVQVLDCTGAEPYAGEVLVEGNRIKQVTKAPDSLPTDGAKVIDGGNAFLMPGLIDSHTHLSINNTSDLIQLAMLPPEEHTLITMHNARFYLDHGFTGCISAGSVKPRLDLVIRNAINAGEIPGPRLIACSPWLTVTGGLGDVRKLHVPFIESLGLTADGPDEFRRLTREMIREGVDIVKLVISGDIGMTNCRDTDTLMTEAEVAAVAEIVHAHGRRMNAHARSAESVKMCVRHGVDIIYHANFADEEALEMLVANKDRLFVSPNIGFPVVAVHEGAAWGLEPDQVEKLGFLKELDGACNVMKHLHQHGVKVLGGGDYGFASVPHGNNARDIEHFIKFFDFTPMEAIMSMTRYCGEAMGLADELGQIQAGFLADLLLVQGNPLADPKILVDCDNLLAVMKDGKFHKEPATAAEPITA